MDFDIVDFRYDWENCKIILCCVMRETRKHFYIHHTIESVEEADEIVSHWEIMTTYFFDPEMQNPN